MRRRHALPLGRLVPPRRRVLVDAKLHAETRYLRVQRPPPVRVARQLVRLSPGDEQASVPRRHAGGPGPLPRSSERHAQGGRDVLQASEGRALLVALLAGREKLKKMRCGPGCTLASFRS